MPLLLKERCIGLYSCHWTINNCNEPHEREEVDDFGQIMIIKNETGYKITIVGSGSDLERLRIKVSNKGLSDKIFFVGRQPQEMMPKYYAMADFCFLSLRDEGTVSWTIPGKLQEYMSAGKPILAAINGDARFIIDDAQCGECVDYNDTTQLASIILFYAQNKEKIQSYGINARSYYQKYFTLENHVDMLEEQFLKLEK